MKERNIENNIITLKTVNDYKEFREVLKVFSGYPYYEILSDKDCKDEYELYIISARKKTLLPVTEQWFSKNDLLYHHIELIGSHNKIATVKKHQIDLFFEDKHDNAVAIAEECSIPVILFISGLQTIPESLYEASHVEGATKWEEFWYITLPMLGNTILLVIVFTIIELLTQNTNPVLKQAYNLMSNMVYDMSAAMLWVFFAIIGAVIGVVIFLYNQLLLKKWN